MDNRKISELTVGELQKLIKETVQKSVAEVMIEFAIVADLEEQLAFEAEMNDLVRSELQYATFPPVNINSSHKIDD